MDVRLKHSMHGAIIRWDVTSPIKVRLEGKRELTLLKDLAVFCGLDWRDYEKLVVHKESGNA